jgi:transposase
MRGDDAICGSLFSYIDLEKRIRADHPLRMIRAVANGALKSLSGELHKLYPPFGRGSIPPERLLRGLLLQAFYSIRSERQLLEPIDHDPLFRWFVGLGIEDPVWDTTTFTKNRDRLLEGDIAAQFLVAVLAQDQVKALLSSEHFSVDDTLLEAWASLKSFRPKDGSGDPPGPGRNGERDFHGEPRRNESHASTTDPEARLFRKGLGNKARLCFMGHALMENRNGLIVGAETTTATGHAERRAALTLIEPHAAPPQPGVDKSLPLRRQGTMTAPILSRRCTVGRSPRMSRRTLTAAVRRSTTAPPAIPAMRSRSASVNASRRPLAGPRRWPACARCGAAACSRLIGNSLSRWPPIISSACPNCSLGASNDPENLSYRVPLHRRRPFSPPQNVSASSTPIIPGAKARSIPKFFSILLGSRAVVENTTRREAQTYYDLQISPLGPLPAHGVLQAESHFCMAIKAENWHKPDNTPCCSGIVASTTSDSPYQFSERRLEGEAIQYEPGAIGYFVHGILKEGEGRRLEAPVEDKHISAKAASG